MTTHELIEMASLDALGMLDPDERDSFEQAFRAADPAVQAQIRREQLRFSRMDDLLPSVQPPLGLRARVIAAVREAIGAAPARRTSDAIPIHSATRVSRMWRVGAFGSMAAALVFGYFTIQFAQASKDLKNAQAMVSRDGVLDTDYGKRFKALIMDPNSQLVSFTPATDAPSLKPARAQLVFNPAKKQAELLVQDLPMTEGEYEVVVVDSKGRTADAVISFKSPTAGVNGASLSNFDMENGKQLLIRLQGSKEAIMKTRGI